jgi:DNA-directed RNA polymerase subunit RPC12/RpoP
LAFLLGSEGGMNLKELSDHESQKRAEHEAKKTSRLNVPNGIACPNCGHEMVDVNQSFVLTSCPPKYEIRCQRCDYRDYRTI